jgi:hypothetical protein
MALNGVQIDPKVPQTPPFVSSPFATSSPSDEIINLKDQVLKAFAHAVHIQILGHSLLLTS